MNPEIQNRIKKSPHWRVIFRPEIYDESQFLELQLIRDLVEKHRVRLRGWYFPHLPRDRNDHEYGDNWFASQSDFMNHLEYWRFYQSKQFIYLSSVRESTEEAWSEKLREYAKSHFMEATKEEIEAIPGYFSIENFIYNVTEYFIFLSKLCSKDIYKGSVSILIELKNIQGYTLTTDINRAWWNLYSASQSDLSFQKTYAVSEMIADPEHLALDAISWFFVRFGWDDLNPDILKTDQENFVKGLL